MPFVLPFTPALSRDLIFETSALAPIEFQIDATIFALAHSINL